MASNAVIGALHVALGLDSAQFEAGLKKSQGTATSFAASLGKGLLGGVAAAAAGFLSFQAVIDGTTAALNKFGDIADKAAQSGLDAGWFQGLAHGASLAGVNMETLSGALNTFNKNVGLASEGKGKLVSQLQELNPALLRNIQLATTQEERIKAVADALADETSASRQAAIATAAFGAEGVKLVSVLKDGGDSIEMMVAHAKEIGLVVPNDLVERADQLGDKLDTASQIIDTQLKIGLTALAPLMVDLVNGAAEFAKWLGAGVEALKKAEQVRASIRSQVDLGRQLDDLRAEQKDFAAGGGLWDIGGQNLIGSGATAEQLKSLFGVELKNGAPVVAVDPYAGMRGRGMSLASTVTPFYGPGSTPAADAGMFGRGGQGRIAPVSPFFTPGGLDNVTGTAKAANDAVTNLMDGLDRSESRVIDYAGAIADSLTGAFTGFADAVLSGVPAVEALSDVLGDLGKQLLNSAISNFFGSLFSGGFGGSWSQPGRMAGTANLLNVGLFADGGITDRPAIFGESGPEAAVPLPDGRSIPVSFTNGGGMGGGASRVLVQMDQGLIGKILQQAHEDAVQVVKTNSPAAVATAQRDKWLG